MGTETVHGVRAGCRYVSPYFVIEPRVTMCRPSFREI